MKTYNDCWITIQGNCFTTMFIYSSKKKENNGFYYYHNLSKSHQKQEITRPKTFLIRKLFMSFRLPCIVTNVNQTQRTSVIHLLPYGRFYSRLCMINTKIVIDIEDRIFFQTSTNENEINPNSLDILIQGSIKYFQAQLGLSKQLFFAFVSYFLQSLTNICHKTH